MSFDKLELDSRLMRAVTKAGYTTPTSVQEEVIPLAMEQKDILANAPTGTGKTAAYLLPALQHLLDFPRKDPGHARVLVLTPTRELATQVREYADKLLAGLGLITGTLTGGVDYNQDNEMLGKNLDLLVATPGRLMDYIEKEKVACRDVEILVIDEADRMLDMGFGPTVDRIAAEARWRKQTLLFSATLEGNAVEGFARELLDEPARISTSPSRRERKKIAQYYYRADDANHKLALLKRLLADEECTKAVVFVRTRERVEKLIAQMDRAGIRTNCLKGEMPQAKRDAAIARFRDGEIKVLIATDVAARGLDIQGITHVINYDLPRHADTYVHRIGRTARAGAKGCAISIVEAHDHPYLGKIERYVGEPIRRRVFQDMKPQTKEPSTPKKAKKPASKVKKPKKPKKK
ncbi:ATP-dependent RNA helicase SrmB [Ferrimonas futtsuensis]|uniref:ATP-dependent RNA helicase SrmB n=1 Tax=Ferrimonas futtsuensis TaxID=364764 RepID=UPI00040A0D76|nr:ATP-dependent RNA helicase SrmB [Ferrimonas futtsuensis]